VGRVAELWRYPVKSMLGERLGHADVTAAGVAGDRSFALIDDETGLIASAKRPARWGRLLELGAGLDPSGVLTVTFPDGEACSTTDGDGDLDTKLSDFLGRKVRVATTAAKGASFEEVWDPGKADSPLYGTRVASEDGNAVVSLPPSPAAPPGTFFDFSSIHLVTTSTLAALRAAYPEGDVDVRRFRPNLVLEVADDLGFVENDWASASFEVGAGGLALAGIMPTMRCVMTTLAQPGLSRDPGILVATNRANRISVRGMGAYACVGVFCRVATNGPVRVGDDVRVLIG
jgi:uncharacterized protein YcbX